MAACYEVPEASLCLIDAFVVRYDAAAGESAELAPHRDAGPLSFIVLLSDGDAFVGGATTFVVAEFDGVDEDAGDGEDGDEDEDKMIMAVEATDMPHFGVQFHPESIATTPYGKKIIKNFLEI